MTVNAVADFFILKGEIGGCPMTQLPVHKLVYLAQGWHLALMGEPLFDEELRAWKHGPVVPLVRNRLIEYHGKPLSPSVARERPDVLYQPASLNVMERVYQMYRECTPGQLIDISHADGSPWHYAWERNKRGGSDVISTVRMKDYFDSLWKSALDNIRVVDVQHLPEDLDDENLKSYL